MAWSSISRRPSSFRGSRIIKAATKKSTQTPSNSNPKSFKPTTKSASSPKAVFSNYANAQRASTGPNYKASKVKAALRAKPGVFSTYANQQRASAPANYAASKARAKSVAKPVAKVAVKPAVVAKVVAKPVAKAPVKAVTKAVATPVTTTTAKPSTQNTTGTPMTLKGSGKAGRFGRRRKWGPRAGLSLTPEMLSSIARQRIVNYR